MVHTCKVNSGKHVFACIKSSGTVWTKSVIFPPFIGKVHAVVLESHALFCTLQPYKLLMGQAPSYLQQEGEVLFSLTEYVPVERI